MRFGKPRIAEYQIGVRGCSNQERRNFNRPDALLGPAAEDFQRDLRQALANVRPRQVLAIVPRIVPSHRACSVAAARMQTLCEGAARHCLQSFSARGRRAGQSDCPAQGGFRPAGKGPPDYRG